MSDEISSLTPSEEAFFESGGETAPENNVEATPDAQIAPDSASATQDQQKEEPRSQESQPVEQHEKKVPLAALHEARRETRELREKMARMEQIFQRLQEQSRQVEVPSIDDNPVGHFQVVQHQLEERIARNERASQEFHRQQAEQAENSRLAAQFNAVEVEFAKETPDYFKAAEYLDKHVSEQLYAQGYSQQEVAAYAFQTFKNWIGTAINAGMNPAHFLYESARARGYSPPPQQATNLSKIAAINKGQQASKSLSTTGGKGSGELTLEAIAEMSPEELDKNWHKIQHLM